MEKIFDIVPVAARPNAALIDNFHPQSGAHRPKAQASLAYDNAGLHVSFKVLDRFVRCVHTGNQEPVFEDSCVEFFVQPDPKGGYFNFETNCGGAMLASHIMDPDIVDGKFRAWSPLPLDWLERFPVSHSLPSVVNPEIADPVEWTISYFIPFETLGVNIGSPKGQLWRGNFYKCGDKTSQPHWASWATIGDKLNFHQPARFGTLKFL